MVVRVEGIDPGDGNGGNLALFGRDRLEFVDQVDTEADLERPVTTDSFRMASGAFVACRWRRVWT